MLEPPFLSAAGTDPFLGQNHTLMLLALLVTYHPPLLLLNTGPWIRGRRARCSRWLRRYGQAERGPRLGGGGGSVVDIRIGERIAVEKEHTPWLDMGGGHGAPAYSTDASIVNILKDIDPTAIGPNQLPHCGARSRPNAQLLITMISSRTNLRRYTEGWWWMGGLELDIRQGVYKAKQWRPLD